MINKKNILKQLMLELELLRENTIAAAQQAYDTATNEENKAENKYDTLGLEAAYLAEGQSQRVLQYEEDIRAFATINPEPIGENKGISIGSLIGLTDEDDKDLWLFLGPSAGGLSIQVEEQDKVFDIKVVTPGSPIGRILEGKHEEDEIELKIGHDKKYYEVMTVL